MFSRRSVLKDLFLLMAVIGTFFAIMLGTRPLSAPDEGRYTEIPREMVASGDFITPRLNGVKYFEKPPLMYWLTSASIKLFGINEWALRFWPAFLGLLTCLMTYGCGRVLYGRRAGLLGAGILSTSLLFYAHTRLLILDMAVSTFMVGALFSFLLATREKILSTQRIYLFCFFVCMALAVLSKGLIGAVLPGASILIWCGLRRDGKTLKLAFKHWGIEFFFLIAAPWHVAVALKNPEFFKFYFVHEHFDRFLTKGHNRYQPFYFFMPILLIGVFPWAGVLMRTLKSTMHMVRRSLDREREALFLLVSAGFIFLFYSASSSKLIPYILPVFPLLSVLMGRYLDDIFDSHQPTPWLSFVLFNAILIVGIPIALWHQDRLFESALQPYWMGLLGVLTLGSLYAFYQRHRMTRTLTSMIGTSLLTLLILNAAWPHIDDRSVKVLAQHINEQKKAGDQIVAFGRYYQDLPPYVEQKIIVTDWKGELEFGMSVEDTGDWMMTRDAFFQRYQEGGRFFVVTRKEFLPDLQRGLALQDINILKETKRDVLIELEHRPGNEDSQ